MRTQLLLLTLLAIPSVATSQDLPVPVATEKAAAVKPGVVIQDNAPGVDGNSEAAKAENRAKGRDDFVVKVLPILKTSPRVAQTHIRELFGNRVFSSIDESSQHLIVRASKETIVEILAIVEELEAQAGQINRPVSPMAHRAPNAESVKSLNAKLKRLESEIDVLARKLRSQPQADQDVSQLKHLIQEAFDGRQDLHRAELLQFQERLQQIESEIESRQTNRERIIAGQVQDALRVQDENSPKSVRD